MGGVREIVLFSIVRSFGFFFDEGRGTVIRGFYVWILNW